MKKLRKPIAVLALCAVLLSCLFTSSYAFNPSSIWNSYYESVNGSIDAGITLTPGSDESERYISWYTDSDSGEVVLSTSLTMLPQQVITASMVQTPQGDNRAQVKLTGLIPGKTYYYKCVSGSEKSDIYSFSTLSSNSFSAVYVTDVHIAEDSENENSLRDKAGKFNSVLAQASLYRPSGIGLVLSAGDQASSGLRSEYTAFTTTPFAKQVSVALAIGNHDRKNIDYRYFAFQPNKANFKVASYVGSDYWFVKGNALFLVMDSNNASMTDHYAFVKDAVAKNPDVKWRVAMFHHDLYGGRIEHRESENKLLRILWAPIADEFGIDLCLLGHSHYYTISNVVYNNKTVTPTKDISAVENAKGTVFMVSGSINNPRTVTEGEELPLGINAGQSYLTSEMVYNILDFTDDSITINSYTVESGEKFNTFTISKTTNAGGHNYKTPTALFAPMLRSIGTVYAVFNNIGMYSDYREMGLDVPFFDGLFG